MPFYSTGPHNCPNCPPNIRRPKHKPPVKEYVPLTLVCSNYSGCGVDMAQCSQCGRTYQISYKVDEILDVTKDIESAERQRLKDTEIVPRKAQS